MRKGAFTGADRRRIGKFEQCNGGTLFLDEIGDMSAALQAKMLRVLQEQRFERVGSNETLQTQVRVLTATNQNLEELGGRGQVSQGPVLSPPRCHDCVPPLRDRLTTWPNWPTTICFASDRELSLDFRSFAPEALDMLQSYSWPGNVRELQSVIKQAMLSCLGLHSPAGSVSRVSAAGQIALEPMRRKVWVLTLPNSSKHLLEG